jgi:hypothetical protein
MQPSHNSKAPGYNPWKLYKVVSWFLKPLLSNATCTYRYMMGAIRVPRYFAHDFLQRTRYTHAFTASWPSLFVVRIGAAARHCSASCARSPV